MSRMLLVALLFATVGGSFAQTTTTITTLPIPTLTTTTTAWPNTTASTTSFTTAVSTTTTLTTSVGATTATPISTTPSVAPTTSVPENTTTANITDVNATAAANTTVPPSTTGRSFAFGMMIRGSFSAFKSASSSQRLLADARWYQELQSATTTTTTLSPAGIQDAIASMKTALAADFAVALVIAASRVSVTQLTFTDTSVNVSFTVQALPGQTFTVDQLQKIQADPAKYLSRTSQVAATYNGGDGTLTVASVQLISAPAGGATTTTTIPSQINSGTIELTTVQIVMIPVAVVAAVILGAVIFVIVYHVRKSSTNGAKNKDATEMQSHTTGPIASPQQGEAEIIDESSMPEGNDWQVHENRGKGNGALLWSAEKYMYYDTKSRCFYDPNSGMWFDPATGEWAAPA